VKLKGKELKEKANYNMETKWGTLSKFLRDYNFELVVPFRLIKGSVQIGTLSVVQQLLVYGKPFLFNNSEIRTSDTFETVKRYDNTSSSLTYLISNKLTAAFLL
jgi:hypothetical protein